MTTDERLARLEDPVVALTVYLVVEFGAVEFGAPQNNVKAASQQAATDFRRICEDIQTGRSA
jgi:hypothetical protein